MKQVNIALFLLVLSCLVTPVVFGEDEYQHILTLESPNPENHAWYGYRIKIDGDLIVVSAPYSRVDDVKDAGNVYVYDTNGSLISTIHSPVPGNDYRFGWAFDVYNNTIIIFERATINNLTWAGKTYIYKASGELLFSLQPSEPKLGGGFGRPTQLDENIIVISETGAETDPGMAGKVHIYDSQGKYIKSLLSPSPKVNGRFGSTIKVGEGMILVGEYGYVKMDQLIGPGSVYVYDYDGNYLMTLQAPEPEDRACFGCSISVSGDRIAIGESYATVDGVWRAGRAYIYNTDGEHLQTLQSPNPKLNGLFGDFVSLDGDRLVVGEWDADVNPLQYEGRAYVFDVDGNLLQNLTAPDPCPRAAFGFDVDIEDDTIVIGECWAATGELGQAGRIHVYKLGAPDTVPNGGGMPGFPVIAIVLGLAIIIIVIKQLRQLSPTFMVK